MVATSKTVDQPRILCNNPSQPQRTLELMTSQLLFTNLCAKSSLRGLNFSSLLAQHCSPMIHLHRNAGASSSGSWPSKREGIFRIPVARQRGSYDYYDLMRGTLCPASWFIPNSNTRQCITPYLRVGECRRLSVHYRQ